MKQSGTNGRANEEDVIHDLLVIGGGINGAGIAADAAGRGLDVVMCEMQDLASGTSSASTKLIHGGLRYLEQYEFRLVRESLAEREVLLRTSPHIVWPLRFQLPHDRTLRPRWMIRAGLFLYDSLSKRVTLPRSRALRFDESSPLVEKYRFGFEYSDCWVDDARLVVLNAMRARNNGARVLTRHECVGLESDNGLWRVTLRDKLAGEDKTLSTRVLVNATGPWVSKLARRLHTQPRVPELRLVKGCHIVVPRLHEQPQAYLLQNSDGRVVFVIPYEQDYSLVGTTEQEFTGDPEQAAISAQETRYLVSVVNHYFKSQLREEDVVHTFAGIRPLLQSEEKNASRVSRGYTLELDTRRAPLLTVYGGKITTYRRLAENAMGRLRQIFPDMPDDWTSTQALPGGDFSSQQELQQTLASRFPWIPQAVRARWVRSYGTLTELLLEDVKEEADLGQHFGHGLYECELRYLRRHEWAMSSDDILWRRSKLGLRFRAAELRALREWLGEVSIAP